MPQVVVIKVPMETVIWKPQNLHLGDKRTGL